MGLLSTRRASRAYESVLTVPVTSFNVGDTVRIIVAVAQPPKLSASSRVRLESRYLCGGVDLLWGRNHSRYTSFLDKSHHLFFAMLCDAIIDEAGKADQSNAPIHQPSSS